MPSLVAPAIDPGVMSLRSQPVLGGDAVVLRPWAASDAPRVLTAYADPDIQRWHARSMTEPEAMAWIAAWATRWHNGSGAGWAVTLDSVLVGQVSLRRIDLIEGLADFSYWVLPPARGGGVATEAVATVSAWAFNDLGLHRLEIAHAVSNPGSCRVAARAGYLFEGTKRSEALHADGWHDMHLHARLADDPD